MDEAGNWCYIGANNVVYFLHLEHRADTIWLNYGTPVSLCRRHDKELMMLKQWSELEAVG